MTFLSHRTTIACAAIVLLTVQLGGCGGEDPVALLIPATITPASSVSLTAVAGTAVAERPSVIVKDATGKLVAGTSVTFAVTGGGGSVSGATVTTGASGVATVGGWTLGPTAGLNVLSVSTGTIASATFTATGIPGPPAASTKAAGDAQTASVGYAVTVPPAVTVRDANGNLVVGAVVTFAVASGGGSVTGATQTTNISGEATVGQWTLGSTVGTNTLTATVGGAPPLTFTASGVLPAPASLAKTAGDGQSQAAGAPVPIAPSVTVRNASGNLVGGAVVTFTVASGGGSVTGGSVTTGSTGVATVGGWTLGATPGPNTLLASAAGAPAVLFTATGLTACAVTTAITVPSTIQGNLTSNDCVLGDGTHVDFYGIPLGNPLAVLLTMSSAEFDTRLSVVGADGVEIASNDNATAATSNSALKALLPIPVRRFGAGAAVPGARGTYTFTTTAASVDNTNCELVFVTRGLQTNQSLSGSDCISGTSARSDRFEIFLTAGKRLDVSMQASSFLPRLELRNNAGTLVAAADGLFDYYYTPEAALSYTPTVSGYYRITATTGSTMSVVTPPLPYVFSIMALP